MKCKDKEVSHSRKNLYVCIFFNKERKKTLWQYKACIPAWEQFTGAEGEQPFIDTSYTNQFILIPPGRVSTL